MGFAILTVCLQGAFMSVSAAITPHLPLLRRFARALSGTQQSGDAYVAATLEAILADQSIFNADLSPRVALYRVFLRTWRAVPTNLAMDRTIGGAEAAASKNLGAIPVAPRIA